jgi:SulP family sulfate permease
MRNSVPIWVSRVLPFIVWLPRVNRGSLKADLVAGMTGAVVVLPQSVAFAAVAGMPLQYGLYAGMIPAIVAALFGSSWHLVSGPTVAGSVVLFSSLSKFAVPGSMEYVQLALTLTFMVGVVQFAMGLARMGVLINFISHAVLVGFTAGAAILIMSKQLKNFFGLEMDTGGHVHEILLQFLAQLETLNPYTTGVGLSTLAVGIVVKLYFPRWPYLIVAMLAGTALGLVLGVFPGSAEAGVENVEALPASLPPLSSPSLTLDTLRQLAPAALAATLFALTEAVSIGRSLALKSGQHINGNQEFVGQGLSNIAGSFFSGYLATGSFNRSAINFQAGARTPVSAVVAAVGLMLVVLVAAPLAAYLPKASMAGVLFLVAWRLIDLQQMKHILRISRAEAAVLLTTFFGALVFDLEFAIFLGVLLSLVLYLKRTSHPAIHPRVPNPNHPRRKFTTDTGLPECPQMKMVRIDGSLFFGAVPHVERLMHIYRKRKPEQKHLLLMMQGVNFVDLAGAEFIAKESNRRRASGGDVYLCRTKEEVLNTLQRGGYLATIGAGNVSQSKTEIIGVAFAKLDREICRRCTARIFRECDSVPGPNDEPEAGVDKGNPAAVSVPA